MALGAFILHWLEGSAKSLENASRRLYLPNGLQWTNRLYRYRLLTN